MFWEGKGQQEGEQRREEDEPAGFEQLKAPDSKRSVSEALSKPNSRKN